MSDVVHYKGYLVRVDLTRVSLEEFAREVLIEDDSLDKLNYHDSCVEVLQYEYEKSYYISEDDTLYEIKRLQDIDLDEDIYEAHMNDAGTISFEVKFYNGGYSFQEALDTALDKL